MKQGIHIPLTIGYKTANPSVKSYNQKSKQTSKDFQNSLLIDQNQTPKKKSLFNAKLIEVVKPSERHRNGNVSATFGTLLGTQDSQQ